MRFTVFSACWKTREDYRALDAILHRIEDEVHTLIIEDSDKLEVSSWFREAGSGTQQYLLSLARNNYPAPGSGPHQIEITIGGTHTPQEAQRLAYTPLTVVMENRHTDGILLNLAILRFGDPCLRALWKNRRACKSGEIIRADSPGGHGEISKLVGADASNSRLLVFTDSDGQWPGDVKAHALTIQSTCGHHQVPCLILSKRTIENYIPDEVLRAWAAYPDSKKARKVEALQRLSPAARDHLPLKACFSKILDSTGQFKGTEEAALYASVSETDRGILAQGLCREPIKLLEEFSADATHAALRKRDPKGDLEALAQMIANAL